MRIQIKVLEDLPKIKKKYMRSEKFYKNNIAKVRKLMPRLTLRWSKKLKL